MLVQLLEQPQTKGQLVSLVQDHKREEDSLNNISASTLPPTRK